VIADQPAAGRVPDIGGPRPEWLPDMARAVAARLGPAARVVPLRMPGALGRAMRDGSLMLDDSGRVRGPSFADWLEAQTIR
jgi:hypothetical protein